MDHGTLELLNYGVHKMDFIYEINVTTGEEKEIPLSATQIKEREAESKITLARIKKEEEAAQAKAAEKAALLAKLGITEDEAKLLLS